VVLTLRRATPDDHPDEQPDAGPVRFAHWGVTQDDRLVVEIERTVLLKRRSHWGTPGSGS
jgi:hypothetical protein